jgi:hypothetical protein
MLDLAAFIIVPIAGAVILLAIVVGVFEVLELLHPIDIRPQYFLKNDNKTSSPTGGFLARLLGWGTWLWRGRGNGRSVRWK